MRVSKEKAAENRAKILEAAGRLLRERGIAGTGVDALMEAAGLTHGSLYSQFGSKERLVTEALHHAISEKGQNVAPTALGRYVAGYLSPTHRDNPGRGCPLAALCSEMPRQPESVRGQFTDGLKGLLQKLASRVDLSRGQKAVGDEALALAASLIGSLVLSRAVNDAKLSDDILRATRKKLGVEH